MTDKPRKNNLARFRIERTVFDSAVENKGGRWVLESMKIAQAKRHRLHKFRAAYREYQAELQGFEHAVPSVVYDPYSLTLELVDDNKPDGEAAVVFTFAEAPGMFIAPDGTEAKLNATEAQTDEFDDSLLDAAEDLKDFLT